LRSATLAPVVAVAVAACSGAAQPPPTAPHPAPAIDAGAGVVALSAQDCDRLIARAIELAAVTRGSAATDEVRGAVTAQIHRDCAGIGSAALACGLAAASLADFEACDAR
jgi:hypothetical protein